MNRESTKRKPQRKTKRKPQRKTKQQQRHGLRHRPGKPEPVKLFEKTLWWLSYAKEIDGVGTSLGVVLIMAEDFFDAAHKSSELGLNPGGSCLGYPLNEQANKDLRKYIGKRITPESAKALGARTIREDMDVIGIDESTDLGPTDDTD